MSGKFKSGLFFSFLKNIHNGLNTERTCFQTIVSSFSIIFMNVFSHAFIWATFSILYVKILCFLIYLRYQLPHLPSIYWLHILLHKITFVRSSCFYTWNYALISYVCGPLRLIGHVINKTYIITQISREVSNKYVHFC